MATCLFKTHFERTQAKQSKAKMSLLSNVVACCGSASSLRRNDSNESPDLINVGLVREKKDVGCRSRRQVVQWRPSLCTISEEEEVDEDVIKTEMYVIMSASNKNRKINYNFNTSGYNKESAV